MAKFYKPELVTVKRTPVIAYLSEGIERKVSRVTNHSLKVYLGELYRMNQIEREPFNIDILWEDSGDLMTDVWKYSQLRKWGSGALATASTFRFLAQVDNCGTSAEFGLSVLGREAEHRIGKTLKEFLESRPVLHPATTNNQRYFINGKNK